MALCDYRLVEGPPGENTRGIKDEGEQECLLLRSWAGRYGVPVTRALDELPQPEALTTKAKANTSVAQRLLQYVGRRCTGRGQIEAAQ